MVSLEVREKRIAGVLPERSRRHEYWDILERVDRKIESHHIALRDRNTNYDLL